MSALPLAGRHVTDAAVCSFHWMFALAFAGAWLTAESERWRLVHVTLGYTLAGLLAFRLLWGWLGPRPARLSVLVRWQKVTSRTTARATISQTDRFLKRFCMRSSGRKGWVAARAAAGGRCIVVPR